jgi:putative endonuclease
MNEIILQIKEKRMARHNDLGKWAEEQAAGWLAEQGFLVRHRNWRYRRGEIDIIATRGEVYHFIEIKCSTGNAFGNPEERVSKAKLRTMMRTASHWLYEHAVPGEKRVRYDVLAIRLMDGKPPEYLLFEDVSL